MNIIGNKKRIAIVGKGTAGSYSALYINQHNLHNHELVWYYDPNKSTQSVGEGSTLVLPETLETGLDFTADNLPEIDATFKSGIRKINWEGSGDFMHYFNLGTYSLHFNSVKLQNLISNHLSKYIPIIDSSITSHSQIDADYIMDCSGTPQNFSNYWEANHIPVNSAYITQCYWEKPEFDYTLTIARPYGWVFGIPLQNRCSIGYLYDKNINTLEEIQEDIKNVFKDFNLTPSTDTNSLYFNNYFKKENHTPRVTFNGNSSFFLEPLEANSIGLMHKNVYRFLQIIDGRNPIDCNKEYLENIISVQRMIMLHYYAGSKFSTKFWDIAFKKAEYFISNNLDSNFKNIYQLSKEYYNQNRINSTNPLHDKLILGQWSVTSYNQNLKELNLYNKLDKLLNI